MRKPTFRINRTRVGHLDKEPKPCVCCGRDVQIRFLDFMTDADRRVWCAMCMQFALSHVDNLDDVREHVAMGPPIEGATLLPEIPKRGDK